MAHRWLASFFLFCQPQKDIKKGKIVHFAPLSALRAFRIRCDICVWGCRGKRRTRISDITVLPFVGNSFRRRNDFSQPNSKYMSVWNFSPPEIMASLRTPPSDAGGYSRQYIFIRYVVVTALESVFTIFFFFQFPAFPFFRCTESYRWGIFLFVFYFLFGRTNPTIGTFINCPSRSIGLHNCFCSKLPVRNSRNCERPG